MILDIWLFGVLFLLFIGSAHPSFSFGLVRGKEKRMERRGEEEEDLSGDHTFEDQ